MHLPPTTHCISLLALLAGLTAAAGAAAPIKRDAQDPLYQVREYFNNRLPGDWWASDPDREGNRFRVRLHVPEGWRGNPTTAAMQFCPDDKNMLWNLTPQITLQPENRSRRWPSHDCHAPLWARAKLLSPGTLQGQP
jgi:hypothetical protein